MADPPAGAPEPLPTNTQESGLNLSVEDFQPRVPTEPLPLAYVPRKRTRSGDSFSSSENSGRVTTREVWKLIDSLKTIITHQTALIESTKAEIEEVKHDQNALRDQNDKLHEEVKALRTQIEAHPPAPPTRSWATVAAEGNATHPQPNPYRPDRDRNCVRISTQRSLVDPRDNEENDGNTFGRYLPTDAANTHIRTALLNAPSTQDAQVAGIGTTKAGYVIRFKDTESAEVARSNSEWLNQLGNDTKLVKPRFGVVVHCTPTEDFDLENASARAIQKVKEENELAEHGFHIEELAWLKRKDKILGKFASLGIWFDSAEGAEYILNNGLLVGQRQIGSVERREIKKKRCFRCQHFGHLAWSCKETPRCGHCAGQHERQRCPSGDLDILLVQEPSITSYRTHVNHSSWRLYRPTIETDATRFRSLIYVNRNLSTSSHRQIACDHPDITAIKIWTAESQTLIFSVYIPPVPLFTPDNTSAEPALTAIQNTLSNATQAGQKSTSVILAGDFNRHHPTWGGNQIPPRFIEDAVDLVNFFQTNRLHSCLPRGTVTYWSLNHPGRNSTIDQTVTDCPDSLVKCHLYHENYGSDHRATYSEWNIQTQRNSIRKRKAYTRATWTKIGHEIQEQIGPWKEIKT
ncbi:hypothetical protein N7490_003108 [Penicillium lividum]|nr:hypothetical protein N7490_003108 [Penicillium lividum]